MSVFSQGQAGIQGQLGASSLQQQQQQQQQAAVTNIVAGRPQSASSNGAPAQQQQQPNGASSSSGQQLLSSPQAYNFLPMLAAAAQEQQRSIHDSLVGNSAANGAQAVVSQLKATGSRSATVVPCRARGMPVDHNFKTAYFVVPEGIEHGDELLCSYPACRSAGCKFRYCLYCKVPVAKRNFRNRHRHGIPGGDGVEELSDSETEDEGVQTTAKAGEADRTDPTGFLTAGTACTTGKFLINGTRGGMFRRRCFR